VNRPNDERGFIHKKIAGIGASILGVTSKFVPGPAGAFLGIGQRALGLIAAPGGPPATISTFTPSIIDIRQPPPRSFGQRAARPPPRIPESDQMRANRSVGIAPQDRFQNGCPPDPGVCAPRGFHVNKSSYFLSDGTFIAKGSRFVRNRRLNNANGRAQDKSIVRLEKGQDHAKKLLKATGYRTISKQSSKELRNQKKAACK